MAKLNTLIQKYQTDMLSTARLSCAALAGMVAFRTPVDDGVLKRSWTPAKNGFDTSNRGGSFEAVANSLQVGDTYTFVNAQKYARRIEYEGHSKLKAPNGMLRISVREWDSIVRRSNRGR